ncbi:alpha-2,8-sialyltransferase 8F-like isoform X2 [Poecilia latipinna]|uniref:alpha-2,8-sialyltransferase 8F-like isoform X2 n=1 Tax=Poecilia latipinna TaxID=48699 RepID=UPI00072E0F64|nr:PREDICTED: alpha-2,8-sialyltransferase 8F-like isoform X2 [Poecilia latipinna]
MRGQASKLLLFLNVFFLASLLVLPFWYSMEKGLEKPRRNLLQSTDSYSLSRESSNQFIDFCSQVSQTEEPDDEQLSEPIKEEPEKTDDKKQEAKPCKGCSKGKSGKIAKKQAAKLRKQYEDCRKNINEMLKPYSKPWKRQEEKHVELRAQLNLKVRGYEKAIITQKNTLVGSVLATDGDKKRVFEVKSEHFDTFLKESPFANKTYGSCAVVGNAGILANSSCGKSIDSAEFVIRCNLAPLKNGYEKHVGVKTDLVSANPSILLQKYDSLLGSRRKFMEKLCQYRSSMILLPAFSYVKNIVLCMRAFHTIQDFGSPMQPIYFNPEYLKDLDTFWRSQGWEAVRLSSGMILTSLALELCDTVDLYGFWPFGLHPQTFKELTHHYYDDVRGKSGFHAMPEEFKLLLQLHSEGILRLHLGDCESKGE